MTQKQRKILIGFRRGSESSLETDVAIAALRDAASAAITEQRQAAEAGILNVAAMLER